MDNKLSQRYQALSEGLKELVQELAALQAENERLSRENIKLREEVSLLRLYVDTYLKAGEDVADLEAMNLIPEVPVPDEGTPASKPEPEPAISDDAMEFYKSLPQSFNFSELFELADLLGVEKQRMKGFMTTYLRENMMQQHGTRVEKTTKPEDFWERSLGRLDERAGDGEKAKKDA